MLSAYLKPTVDGMRMKEEKKLKRNENHEIYKNAFNINVAPDLTT
jgi:hypothetical protein